MPIDNEDCPDEILSDIENEEIKIYDNHNALDEEPIETITVTTCQFGDPTCQDEKVIPCIRCHRRFCLLHASRFSPNVCMDCFKPLSIVIDKVERRVTDYDLLDDKFLVKISKGTQITINLEEWIFHTLWIRDLTDEELKTVFEFHYSMVEMIRVENDTRKIRKLQTLRNMSFGERKAALKVKPVKTQQQAKILTAPDIRAKLKKDNPSMSDEKIELMVGILMS